MKKKLLTRNGKGCENLSVLTTAADRGIKWLFRMCVFGSPHTSVEFYFVLPVLYYWSGKPGEAERLNHNNPSLLRWLAAEVFKNPLWRESSLNQVPNILPQTNSIKYEHTTKKPHKFSNICRRKKQLTNLNPKNIRHWNYCLQNIK